MPSNRQYWIGGGISVILIVSVVLIIVFLTSRPVVTPTITPTITPSVPDENISVTLTTEIDGSIECVGFGPPPITQLLHGKCGDPDIQGQWFYDPATKVLSQTNSLLSQNNCMINNPFIVDPRVRGAVVTSGDANACRGITLTLDGTGLIHGQNNIVIGLFQDVLGWTTLTNLGLVFTIST